MGVGGRGGGLSRESGVVGYMFEGKLLQPHPQLSL